MSKVQKSMKKGAKVAPKLPRFKAPKSMISKIFLDKKTKAKTRRVKKVELDDEDENS